MALQTEIQDPKSVRERCERFLTAHGWRREVAGVDWEPAIEACCIALKYSNVGVLVTGAFGCGKTAFIKAMGVCTTINLCENKNLEGYDPVENILLDDLGAELPYNDYGIRREPVGEFILRFYNRKDHPRLYITTNLTPEEIVARYGGRVADRLKELCVPVAFKGASKRRWVS